MSTATTLPLSRSYRLTAPNVADTPRLARHHVAAVLRHTGHPGLVDTARLLVSELFTNVFEHTAVPWLDVRTRVWPHLVRVAVHDDAPTWTADWPTPTPVSPLAECGRGLTLLATLAAAWGVAWEGAPPEAKSVWFELREGA